MGIVEELVEIWPNEVCDKHIVLIDGTLVTTCLAPGKCIKERIDNWLKSCAPSTVSTNIVEAISITPLFLTSDILSQEVCTSEVSSADLEELHLLDTVAVSTLKQADTIRKWISEASKAKSTFYPTTWVSWLGKMAKSLFIFLFFSFLFLFLWTYNYKVERGKVSRHKSQSQCVTWLE